jgi:hypothetical protein
MLYTLTQQNGKFYVHGDINYISGLFKAIFKYMITPEELGKGEISLSVNPKGGFNLEASIDLTKYVDEHKDIMMAFLNVVAHSHMQLDLLEKASLQLKGEIQHAENVDKQSESVYKMS